LVGAASVLSVHEVCNSAMHVFAPRFAPFCLIGAKPHCARSSSGREEILKGLGLSVRECHFECVSRETLKTIALPFYQSVLVFEYRKNMFNGGISTTLNSYVLIAILHA